MKKLSARSNKYGHRKKNEQGRHDSSIREWENIRVKAARLLAQRIHKTGDSPSCFSTTVSDGVEVVEVNQTLFLVAAWLEEDAEVAAALISGVLSLQSPDGTLKARYLTDGTPVSDCAAWPLIVQAAALVLKKTRSAKLLKPLLPQLYRYLEAAIKYFDPQHTGQPCWHSRDESFMPDSFQTETASPDLAVFLLAEMIAIRRIEKSLQESLPSAPDFELERSVYVESLQDDFWDADDYRLMMIDKRSKKRLEAPPQFTSLTVMAVDELSALMARISPQVKQWVRLGGFELCQGQDGSATNLCFAIFMLLGLDRRQDKTAYVLLKSNLRRVILESSADAHLFGREDEEETFPGSLISGIQVAASALVILSTRQSGEPDIQPTSRELFLQFLNRHPRAAIGVPVGVFIILVAIVAGVLLLTPGRYDPTFEVQMSVARLKMERSQFEEAITLYDELIESHPGMVQPMLMKALAYVHMREYREAADIYGQLVGREGVSPLVAVDLSLSLDSAGDSDAAFQVFREFREQYGDVYPQEVRRLRHALLGRHAGDEPTDAEDPSPDEEEPFYHGIELQDEQLERLVD